MSRPVRLLVRDLCLIVQPCLRLCSTAADFFPGSGFPVSTPGDKPGALTGFFLHRRRLLRQRQNPCIISICLSAFRSLLAHGTTGHWHRVSPMLFPNAGVPTAPTVESFRLSERFSSRLCTELQKRPGGTHYKYSIFNVENPGRTASRILRERCSLKTNKSYNSRISSALNLWFIICKSGNTKGQTCSAVNYSR